MDHNLSADDTIKQHFSPDDTVKQRLSVKERGRLKKLTTSPTRPMIAPPPSPPAPPRSRREAVLQQLFQGHCNQLIASTFFRDQNPIHTLGVTSAINGEGKSFLAAMTANLLASQAEVPVTLVEWNWEHPSIHEYYQIPATPGAAERLRRECSMQEIRRQVGQNLTVIPAGQGKGDALKLLSQMRQLDPRQMFAAEDHLLIVDLPAVVSTPYGQLAASLVDEVVVVVHAGVTPDTLVAEACARLARVSIHGLILNQMESNIPRWLRQLL